MRLSVLAMTTAAAAALIAGFSSCAPHPQAECSVPGAARPLLLMTLVYPEDGATAVPDSPSALVFSFVPGPSLNGAKAVLTPPSGPAVVSGPSEPVPSPLPTPNSNPTPGTRLVAFSVSPLAAATTYQVSFKGSYTTTGICGGTFPLVGTGSFTTR